MDKTPKILVVGSLVMDQIASTSHFPRQGQTVLGNAFHKAPGGKGANQAVQAARLGADVTMVGKLGADANGKDLLAACNAAGIHTEKIIIDRNGTSGCAVIILEEVPGENTHNRIIVIPGTNMQVTPDDVSFLEEKVAMYDLVMLQLEIPMDINELVAEYANKKNVPVMLNSAPSAPLSDSFLSHLTFISPNEHEIEDMTGIHIHHEGTDVDMGAAARAADVLHRKGVKNVLITLGSAGAVLFAEDGTVHLSPCAKGITAVDPTAAGDSFVGAFCTGFCAGWSWEEILMFANHTAAITVSGMGAMPSLPGLKKVEDFLKLKKGISLNTSCLKVKDVKE